jgi:hypothetical protein
MKLILQKESTYLCKFSSDCTNVSYLSQGASRNNYETVYGNAVTSLLFAGKLLFFVIHSVKKKLFKRE